MKPQTPSPYWEAVERIDGKWEVRGDHADSSEGIPLFPGTEADARIAAAAPDMYRALLLIRTLVAVYVAADSGTGIKISQVAQGAIDKAEERAAIESAEVRNA